MWDEGGRPGQQGAAAVLQGPGSSAARGGVGAVRGPEGAGRRGSAVEVEAAVGERRMRATPHRAGGGRGEPGQGTGEAGGSVVAMSKERSVSDVREGAARVSVD